MRSKRYAVSVTFLSHLNVAKGRMLCSLFLQTAPVESSTAEPALNRSTAGGGSAGGGGGGGTDLAASLAAALNKRKGTMGDDSDEEGGDSDDEWD